MGLLIYIMENIVYWFPEKENHHCGYCKSTTGNISYGMWAQSLTTTEYQELIDRGWRRSGHYCYKPMLDETCCPLYTIRCNALELSLSKSQKKVIKKFNKFLNDGILKERKEYTPNNIDDESYNQVPNFNIEDIDLSKVSECQENPQNKPEKLPETKEIVKDMPVILPSISKTKTALREQKVVQKGSGADPEKPPKKKSKILRLERKMNKLKNVETPKIEKNESKTLEQFMGEISENGKHKLKINLVKPMKSKAEWQKYEKVEFELFQKYQMIIHNESADKNDLKSFSRFLVDSPLEDVDKSDIEYGSYHQQYWLDEKLIAVGVIDILPKCISAVYFFYDPDYRELTLGTYGALKELELVRQLQVKNPNLKYYYMGFYIHTCQKMRYKGKMTPSFLLCPETYIWCPIEKCLPKIETSKYSRFNDDPNSVDENECLTSDLDNLRIIYRNKIYPYWILKSSSKDLGSYELFGKLCGKKLMNKLFLVER